MVKKLLTKKTLTPYTSITLKRISESLKMLISLLLKSPVWRNSEEAELRWVSLSAAPASKINITHSLVWSCLFWLRKGPFHWLLRPLYCYLASQWLSQHNASSFQSSLSFLWLYHFILESAGTEMFSTALTLSSKKEPTRTGLTNLSCNDYQRRLCWKWKCERKCSSQNRFFLLESLEKKLIPLCGC